MLLSYEEIGYLKDSQLILETIDKIKTFALNQDNVSEVSFPNPFLDNGEIIVQLAVSIQLNSV